MSRRKISLSALSLLAALSAGAIAASAATDVAAPQRKAGWWQMSAHLPNGSTMTRYLCLDATSDARHSVLEAKEGCTMTAQKIAGGYSFQNACAGGATSGTAIGDFNSAYKISEQKGSAHMETDATWMGACPAGRKPGDMLLPSGVVVNMD